MSEAYEIKNSIEFIGGLIASGLSYVVNHSFWWALLHFFCGFFYVAYWLAFHLPAFLK